MHPEAQANAVIHGVWMTPLSREHRVSRYEQRGQKIVVPAYPGSSRARLVLRSCTEIRRHWRTSAYARSSINLVTVIEALDTKPIIMGHSFGAAFVQLLLDAGFGTQALQWLQISRREVLFGQG